MNKRKTLYAKLINQDDLYRIGWLIKEHEKLFLGINFLSSTIIEQPYIIKKLTNKELVLESITNNQKEIRTELIEK